MSRGAGWYSRLGVGRLVAFKRMAEVVLVVHVTLSAQVVVEAHFALPSHSHDAMLLAAVTDDIGVTHPCVKGKVVEGEKKQFLRNFSFFGTFFIADL